MLFNLFVIQASHHASATLIGTVIGTVPVILALVSWPLAVPPLRRVLAAALVVVVGATITTGLGSGSVIGLLYAVGALACEACFSLLALPLPLRLGPIRVSAHTQTIAVPVLLLVGAVADGSGMFCPPTAAEAASLPYLSLVVSAGAFLLWYDALGRPRGRPGRAVRRRGPAGRGRDLGPARPGRPTAAELGGAAVVVAGLAVGLGGLPVTVPAIATVAAGDVVSSSAGELDPDRSRAWRPCVTATPRPPARLRPRPDRGRSGAALEGLGEALYLERDYREVRALRARVRRLPDGGPDHGRGRAARTLAWI